MRVSTKRIANVIPSARASLVLSWATIKLESIGWLVVVRFSVVVKIVEIDVGSVRSISGIDALVTNVRSQL